MRGLEAFYAQKKVTKTYFVLFPLLFLLSGIYGLLLEILKFLYRAGILRSYRSSAKVISVGNITLGGSGKTPLVEYLADLLTRDGHRVAILLRGYKRPQQPSAGVSQDYYTNGDEGSMLKQNLKGRATVLTGPDRVGLTRRLDEEGGFDTIILDDGFQHWKLKRDLDIVTIDATDPFGNGLLLPAGHLREEVSSLARADIFCLTRCDEATEEKCRKLKSRLTNINPRSSVVIAIHAPENLYQLGTEKEAGLDALRGDQVCVLCGIANPCSFLTSVQKLGARVAMKSFFQDHHPYREHEIIDIAKKCIDARADKIVTTQKDAVRLAGLSCLKDLGVDIWVLRIGLKIIVGKEGLDGRLRSLYHS